MQESKARPRVAALLVAAGSGTRLGLGPKAFLELAGITLLERTASLLRSSADELLVAVPPGAVEAAARLVPYARVIAGGSTRQQSVHALLATCRAELVIVHDVARPFLSQAVVSAVLSAAERTGAATAAMPVADTLVRSDGTAVVREGTWSVQTPQAFRGQVLRRAHQLAMERGTSATDDAGLVRLLGERVELVMGSPWLFKVTEPEDLEMARALAPTWDSARAR